MSLKRRRGNFGHNTKAADLEEIYVQVKARVDGGGYYAGSITAGSGLTGGRPRQRA